MPIFSDPPSGPVVLPDPMGCSWPIDPACLGDEWDSFDTSIQDRSVALASATLRRLTGYRVGGCPITVRPCKKPLADALRYMRNYWDFNRLGWFPIDLGGVWINSCGCRQDCSCTVICEIALPKPVMGPIVVKQDGVVIDPLFYRVDVGSLVWSDPTLECAWPSCQNLSLPDTEVGTFSVTYLNSYPVDSLGAYAAGVLAMEYARACAGGKCRLPAGVTSIARQGVSIQVASGAFPGGMTGIREIDAYLALWRPPGSPTQQTGVWSPDLHPPRVMR